MKRIIPLLAILLTTTSTFATDNEFEKLKTEIRIMHQTIADLSQRIAILESKASPKTSHAIRTSKDRRTFNPSTSKTTKKQSEKIEYEIVKVLPKVRIAGKHAYEIIGITTSKDWTTNNRERLSIQLRYTNKGNDSWNIRDEKHTLRLDNIDIQGQYSFGSQSSISKNGRKKQQLTFMIEDPKPVIAATLVIESKANRTKAQIKIKLKRKVTKAP